MLLSVSQRDWLASFNLREAYLPVTVHLLLVPFFASCYVTRSTSSKLCALASPRLRRSSPGSWLLFQLYSILLGIRMRRYLDTWLVQSSSQESLLEVLLPVLRLCPVFGIVIPSQVFQPHTFPGSAVSVGRLRFHLFLGFSVSGTHLLAAILQPPYLCHAPRLPTSLWLSLLGVLSSLSSPSSGRLAFFLSWLASFLAATWDCSPSSSASIVPGTVRIWRLPILASMECLHGLQWWLHLPRLSLCVSLHQVSPVLHFWSDASDVGWGAHLDCQVASGL